MTEVGFLLAFFLALAAHQRASALATWQHAVLEALAGAVSRKPPPGPLDDPNHAASFVRDIVATGVQSWRGVLDLSAMMEVPPPPPIYVDGKAVLDAIISTKSAPRGVV